MASTGVITGQQTTMTVDIASNLSAKEGYAVKLDTSTENLIAITEDSTLPPFVLLEGANGASTATIGTIVISGTAKVKAGGVIAPGDRLTATTGGKWIKTVTNKQNYGATALEIGADGDLISAIVERGLISA